MKDTGAVVSAKKDKKRKSRDKEDIEENPKRQKTDYNPQKNKGVEVRTEKEETLRLGSDDSPTDPTANGSEKRGKKRRRRKTQDIEGLPEEERKRREEQRYLAARARQMRAEGKTYKRPQKRLATEAAKQNLANPNARMKNEPKYEEEEGSKPDSSVQVIVIPIFWNRKPEEKAGVIDASAQIVRLLQGSGIVCGMDTTTTLSPGQKFAHWENEGVRVRIECGPQDVARGSCVLAVNRKAGELAQKQPTQVGQTLVSKTKVALGIQGQAQAEDVDMVGGDLPKPIARKRQLSSGDDLGGDFLDFNLTEETSKRRKKASK